MTQFQNALLDELEKIAAERKKPLDEKIVDVGAPMIVGSGVGKTLSRLSLHSEIGASPRRQTAGVVLGALGGLGYYSHKQKKKQRKKAYRAQSKTAAAAPFTFPGVSTKRFLSKPGKSIPDISPKIGRIGTLPKMP